ncbi:hypothetical protein BJX99DRAFT_229059 [Aspergillus californicus]
MSLQPPSYSATPEGIRNYFIQVLKTKYNATDDVAEKAVSPWQLGRGKELHETSQTYFKDLFGPEIGLCLYRSVKEDRSKTYERSLVGRGCLGMLLLSVIYVFWSLFVPPSKAFIPSLLFGVAAIINGYMRPEDRTTMLLCGGFAICSALVMNLIPR